MALIQLTLKTSTCMQEYKNTVKIMIQISTILSYQSSTSHQLPASQQYCSLITNQHQPLATAKRTQRGLLSWGALGLVASKVTSGSYSITIASPCGPSQGNTTKLTSVISSCGCDSNVESLYAKKIRKLNYNFISR